MSPKQLLSIVQFQTQLNNFSSLVSAQTLSNAQITPELDHEPMNQPQH